MTPCPDCADTGYVMQDIGTATIPDYIEVPCDCNPIASDTDWTFIGTAYEDFRPAFNDAKYNGL